MQTEQINLLESIKVEDRQIVNLEYHQQRIAAALMALHNNSSTIDFEPIEKEIKQLTTGKFKLRIVYNYSYFKYTILPYQTKVVKSLKLVNGDDVAYQFKFEDRRALDNLYQQRERADDILIIKSGMLTDSYYCNIALLKDKNWYTPYLPLLSGTKRQQLLENKELIESMITPEDLKSFSKVRLFNAMIEFGEIELPVSQITS